MQKLKYFQMARILLISLLLFGCSKQKTCIECVKQNDTFVGCKGDDLHEETDISEIYRSLENNGYECEIYSD